MKNPVKGALDQLSTKVTPLGLVEHYLWGFQGWSEPRVLISEETYQRIRSFLLEGTDDILRDIEGWMADDGDSIPFGTRVGVTLCMEDRHDDESAWFFSIRRPDGTR